VGVMFTNMNFLRMVMFTSAFLISSNALSVECKSSDEKTKLDEVIHWAEFECDKSGECGVVIRVPNLVGNAKFSGLALVKGNSEKLDFLASIPTSINGEFSIATVSGRRNS
jgi:hypothetical protein